MVVYHTMSCRRQQVLFSVMIFLPAEGNQNGNEIAIPETVFVSWSLIFCDEIKYAAINIIGGA